MCNAQADVRYVPIADTLAINARDAQVFADYFRLGVALDPLCAWIPGSDKSIGVELEDCVVDDRFYKAAVSARSATMKKKSFSAMRLHCSFPSTGRSRLVSS